MTHYIVKPASMGGVTMIAGERASVTWPAACSPCSSTA
jgi:hypothetical protein